MHRSVACPLNLFLLSIVFLALALNPDGRISPCGLSTFFYTKSLVFDHVLLDEVQHGALCTTFHSRLHIGMQEISDNILFIYDTLRCSIVIASCLELSQYFYIAESHSIKMDEMSGS